MRERVKDLIKVTLMVGLSILGITFMYNLESNYISSNHEVISYADPPIVTDTIIPILGFMDKPAKEGLQEALEFYGVKHPDIVYAQAILETGHFKSTGCLEHNNLFGLYNSKAKRYCRFNHWSESVVAYKEWIQNKYKPPEDYYKFLSRIHYAEDPAYISKLKQIVKKQDDKRRYTEGDSLS